MNRMHALICLLVLASLPVLAQEPSWTKTLKEGDKRMALHDSAEQVRGDSGKWNDEARVQHTPTPSQKPARMSLDSWADQVQKKPVQLTATDDNWLIFRSEQLDDNDRVWIEQVQRRGNQIIVDLNQAKWQGKYFRNFTYYQVIGVNLGKLEPGKYDVTWKIKALVFGKFDGDGKPQTFNKLNSNVKPVDNWPRDEQVLDKKPAELRISFKVDNSAP